MRRVATSFILSALTLSLAQTASAQVAEVRLGVTEHDVSIFGLGANKGKENSVAITADWIFEDLDALSFIGSPQPYIGGTYNLGGKTSYGGGGLLWRANLFDRLYAEYGFGAVIHDGTREVPNPTPAFTPEEIDFIRFREVREIEFGSRVLFRNQIALGYRIDRTWAVESYIEHLSHGRILSSGSNEGLDTYGFRLAYRY